MTIGNQSLSDIFVKEKLREISNNFLEFSKFLINNFGIYINSEVSLLDCDGRFDLVSYVHDGSVYTDKKQILMNLLRGITRHSSNPDHNICISRVCGRATENKLISDGSPRGNFYRKQLLFSFKKRISKVNTIFIKHLG